MKATIKDLSFDVYGNQTLSFTVKGDARSTYDELKNSDVELTVKKFREKRSLDANRYFWVLLDKLAEKVGRPKIEIYRDYVKNIGGNCYHGCFTEKEIDNVMRDWESNGIGWVAEAIPSKVEGCKVAMLYYGSSLYNTAQMSRLIEATVEDCHAVGIETLSPAELNLMKEAWGNA